jgi:signal transduction histidine kinase
VLRVEVTIEDDTVQIRFRDSGPGVSNPDALFKPFHPGASSTGLGLYISRAVLKSYGGDLYLEPEVRGGCFVVQLWAAEDDGNFAGSRVDS